MTEADDVRLAIIGCGAVAELAHLPAVGRVRNGRVTLLVDPNAARRESLARTFAVERTAADAVAFADSFDAAIVAAPHALHAPIALQLAALGKSILVEKPMANTSAECAAMNEAADRAGVVLAVGLMRRFLWAHRLVRELIRSEVFGAVRAFDFSEGAVYYWPVASDFFFRKQTAGGGVLMDTGAHTLDSLLWWLGPVKEVEYFDDAEGGVEANCLLKLRMVTGAAGAVELSRTRRLRNTARIQMERGSLEVGLDNNLLKVWLENHPYSVAGRVGHRARPEVEQDYLSAISEQMQDWIDATRQRRSPFVEGRSAAESVRLIERCYLMRQPLVQDWDDLTHRGSQQIG